MRSLGRQKSDLELKATGDPIYPWQRTALIHLDKLLIPGYRAECIFND